jgi:hypothetical protein
MPVRATVSALTAGGTKVTRTILAHINIEVADDDKRSWDEIQSVIDGAVEVGFSGEQTAGMTAVIADVEEV